MRVEIPSGSPAMRQLLISKQHRAWQEPDGFTIWLPLAAACAVQSWSNTAEHVLQHSV
jgi:hypothetical protein